MNRPTLTPKLALAAGADLANRRMRAEGRTVWTTADFDAAVDEMHRLLRQAGMLIEEPETTP